MRQNETVQRIAFICSESDFEFHVRRVLSGVCSFATPKRGFITREFFLTEGSKTLPDTCEAWNPAAIILFVGEEWLEVMNSVEESGRPSVNTARCNPSSNRGVVLGIAEEIYALAHACFERLGCRHIAQFVIAESDYSGKLVYQRYQRFTKSQDLPFHSFSDILPFLSLAEIDDIQSVEPAIAEQLLAMPKPAGIFSQSTFAGNLICHWCRLLELRVPEDIAVIGVGDFDVANTSRPPLTTARLPAEKIGYEAASLVADMLSGREAPQDFIYVPGIRLRERASTGYKPKANFDLDEALQFIDSYACNGVKVSDVVKQTQLVSRMTFYKRFQEEIGEAPAQFIRMRKHREAMRLLATTNLSIGAISRMCGYNDDFYFSQCFRKIEGISPSRYRKLLTARAD